MGGRVRNDSCTCEFQDIAIEDRQKIVTRLPNKRGTEEGIASEVLGMEFRTIKKNILM